MLTTTKDLPLADTTRPGARLPLVAGGAYVASWLAGLALAPASPAPSAPADAVHSFYGSAAADVVAASLLTHGTAGVALAGLAVGLARATGVGGGLRRAVAGPGLVAAGLSLVQVAIALAATGGHDRLAPAASRALFEALNLVDVLKIAVLAAFVAAATTAAARAGAAPTWLRAVAGVLVPLLPVTSAAVLVDVPALMAGLGVALVLLLVWAGGVAVTVGRSAR